MLGYETMGCRCELCCFRVEDIEYLTQDKVHISPRFPKTNQCGEDKFTLISPALAAVIENWRITMQVDNGYILREVTKTSSIKPAMRPSSINLKLKILQRAAKLE